MYVVKSAQRFFPWRETVGAACEGFRWGDVGPESATPFCAA